mmetsp:Transcript_7562/g.18378  ORF Transcript_7562/g.18378 Transcript_7562/m.18378 type:complete len:255 (+) Transcript_7562:951-1715(+)
MCPIAIHLIALPPSPDPKTIIAVRHASTCTHTHIHTTNEMTRSTCMLTTLEKTLITSPMSPAIRHILMNRLSRTQGTGMKIPYIGSPANTSTRNQPRRYSLAITWGSVEALWWWVTRRKRTAASTTYETSARMPKVSLRFQKVGPCHVLAPGRRRLASTYFVEGAISPMSPPWFSQSAKATPSVVMARMSVMQRKVTAKCSRLTHLLALCTGLSHHGLCLTSFCFACAVSHQSMLLFCVALPILAPAATALAAL